MSAIYYSLINQLNETLGEALTETLVNETEAGAGGATNGTKFKATPEGKATAYVSIVLMAVLPIIVGAFKSVKHHHEQKIKQKDTGEKPETMTSKDAAMFPFIASGALLGLYIFFKLFSKEYINLLLTGYFFLLGVLALTHILTPVVEKYLPSSFPVISYHLLFSKESGSESEDEEGNSSINGEVLVDYKFDTRTLLCLLISGLLGVWYLLKKHWIANNLFGIAFAINGVELLHLNSVLTGCILLGGLFIYDIFWVFGTDVMVTVAKSFEAPIKLVFPQDILEKGVHGENFAMLGLGDIVIPGIFIALLLRYDLSLKRKNNVYFYTCFTAYVIGLVFTIVVMTYFNHAQPALLYLVPACVGTPLFLALLRGDITSMFKYEDHPQPTEDKDPKSLSTGGDLTAAPSSSPKSKTSKDSKKVK